MTTSPGRTPGDDAYWKRTRDAQRLRIEPKALRRMRDRYRGLCAYCGLSEATTLDHVRPLGAGGRNSEGNLLPCCGSCNPSKSNLSLMEWRTSGRPKVPERLRLPASARDHARSLDAEAYRPTPGRILNDYFTAEEITKAFLR